MVKSSTETNWQYKLTTEEPFKDQQSSENKSFHTFKGYPMPDDNVINEIGLMGVLEIDKIIKEIISSRTESFGQGSTKVPFNSPNLHFKHNTKQNLELKCISGTIFDDPSLPTERFLKFPLRANSLDNYKVIFSERVQKILDDGGKIL